MKAPRIAYFVGLSAMFADMGYQGAMALLPVYLVFVLKLNFIYFGIAEALIFGFGSLFSYLGGKLSDRYGSKNVAVAGNSLIPFLSFTGFTYIPLISVGLFSTGWWMRNLRSPARRAFLAENTEENERTSSFGILHSLDVGGGIISILILVILILLNFTYKYLFLFSIFPIIISTLILASIKSNKHLPLKKSNKKTVLENNKYIFYGIIIATSLFGFGSYSMGFPIITVAQNADYSQSLKIISGIVSYGIFLGFSSLTGYILSRVNIKSQISSLAIFGYILSGAGTLGIVITLIYGLGLPGFYISIIIASVAFGIVETYEPSIISKSVDASKLGAGMGILSSSRSVGYFIANLIMGFLYEISPEFSYAYAGIVSIAAGIIILAFLNIQRKLEPVKI